MIDIKFDPFLTKSTCKKCGSSEKTLKYIGASYIVFHSPEHMKITCKGCGYFWYESCLDAKEQTASGGCDGNTSY